MNEQINGNILPNKPGSQEEGEKVVGKLPN